MLKKCVICGAVFDARNGAKACAGACRKVLPRIYKQTPEYKARERARKHARAQTPEYKAQAASRNRVRRQKPEYRAYMRDYLRTYKQTPKYRAYCSASWRRASTTRRVLAMAAAADAVRIGFAQLTDNKEAGQ
jgi:predicted  nucleic acid-binding Zn-ribbon protein